VGAFYTPSILIFQLRKYPLLSYNVPLRIRGNYRMGQFAGIGLLTIVIALIVLALGLGTSKGRFEYEDLKIVGPLWFIMFMTGVVLTIIP